MNDWMATERAERLAHLTDLFQRGGEGAREYVEEAAATLERSHPVMHAGLHRDICKLTGGHVGVRSSLKPCTGRNAYTWPAPTPAPIVPVRASKRKAKAC